MVISKNEAIQELRKQCYRESLFGIDFEQRDMAIAVSNCLNYDCSISEVNDILVEEGVTKYNVGQLVVAGVLVDFNGEWGVYHHSLNNGEHPFKSQLMKQYVEMKYREIAHCFGLGELSNFVWLSDGEHCRFDLEHYKGAYSPTPYFEHQSKYITTQKIARHLIVFLSDF